MSNKTFGFGQRVKYDGHNGVSLVIGKAITDPSGNVTDDWWWVATPVLPSVLTHAENIEPIEASLPEDQIALTEKMLGKIDHMIVRMKGQTSHYRDELESIAAEFGFRVPGGISSYENGA